MISWNIFRSSCRCLRSRCPTTRCRICPVPATGTGKRAATGSRGPQFESSPPSSCPRSICLASLATSSARSVKSGSQNSISTASSARHVRQRTGRPTSTVGSATGASRSLGFTAKTATAAPCRVISAATGQCRLRQLHATRPLVVGGQRQLLHRRRNLQLKVVRQRSSKRLFIKSHKSFFTKTKKLKSIVSCGNPSWTCRLMALEASIVSRVPC